MRYLQGCNKPRSKPNKRYQRLIDQRRRAHYNYKEGATTEIEFLRRMGALCLKSLRGMTVIEWEKATADPRDADAGNDTDDSLRYCNFFE